LHAEDGGDEDVIQERLQATRTLWDENYLTNNTIGVQESPRLIPRMKEIIENSYSGNPKPKLAFSLYRYGGERHISGAIAVADILGIFAKYEIYAAASYYQPWHDRGDAANKYYVNAAFNMYRNYDGNQSKFGDTYILSETDDYEKSSVYASVESGNSEKMVVVVINKENEPLTAKITINHSFGFTIGKVFKLTGELNQVTSSQNITNITDNSFIYEMPARSISTIELN